MIRAILIDPSTRSVSEILLDGKLKDYYKVMDCNMITVVYTFEQDTMFNGHVIYADDEGLFKDERHFTRVTRQSAPVAGKMVVVGDDGDGGSTDCWLCVDQVHESVEWGMGELTPA